MSKYSSSEHVKMKKEKVDDVNRSEGFLKNSEILFVDDEKELLYTVDEYLTQMGYNITVVDSALKALELTKKSRIDILITDLKMPEVNGLELLKAVKEYQPETEVIILTGYGSIETAVEALKLGGYDYLQKPIKLGRLKALIDRILEKKSLKEENLFLRSRLRERYRYDELIGASTRMQRIYEIIDRISLKSPTVLIHGESGTGKGVVAKVIQQNSDRKDKPFISINCGAIVEGLLESELFGHVRGAFTGAVRDKIGLFRVAEGGTVFLDEIAEMAPHLQVKLLRVLQEKEIRPIGHTREFKVNTRIIAATNRDPEELVGSGVLRKDLYYRLNVVSIHIPPLRERKEDISFLINHFMEKFREGEKRFGKKISPEAMEILLENDWPGNVRELENVIQRAFALGVGETIEVADLPSAIIKTANENLKTELKPYSLKENEIILIKKALRKTDCKKSKAAKLLGIDVSTLYRKIGKYGISDKPLQIANT